MTPATRRRALAGGVFAAAGLLLWASAAWACVPQPYITTAPMQSGRPGTHVDVTGDRFSGSTIELRWNALDGPLLGTSTGPSVHFEFAVPDVAPGLYTLVAMARVADGTVSSVVRDSFQVTSAEPGPAAGKEPHSPDRSVGGTALAVAAGAIPVGIIAFLAGARRRRAPDPGRPSVASSPAREPAASTALTSDRA